MATQTERLGRSRTRQTRTRASVTRLRPSHPAVLLSIVTGSLVLLGLIMVLSASSVTSFAQYGSSFSVFNKQLVWTVLGVAGFVLFARLDYHRLRGFGYVLMAVSMLMLFAVLVPGIGVTVGGSARWLAFGPLSVQPSEITKLALILFAADVFSRKDERSFDSFSHTVLPMLPVLVIVAGLIMLQPDLGTTVIVGSLGLGMLFIAGAPLAYLFPLATSGSVIALTAALIEPYRRDRILSFLHPWRTPLTTGYQTIQSLIAMGTGGWVGVGLGASRQKWSFVPNAHTDFIFAILGEEMGLLGSLVVLGTFAFIAYLGIKVARSAPDRFGMLTAAGITIWLVVQALVNMGAVTGAMPITGVPLPLVSFGGTSLVISLVGMGILVSIARQARIAAPARSRRRAARPAGGR
ncbi:MAG: cell division protein FtsW [Actinomycetota bacterium]|jgi:cell division protein FtsW|nr:cell division protein FtsW [Actinomycetota bacterium]